MAVIRRSIPHPPDEVWAALVTPETYPLWLIGCQDIRSVEPGWPAAGTALHRVGLTGGITVADSTEVIEADPPERLVLEVRVRPLGRGRVTFTLEPAPDGATVVAMEEVPIGALGPLRPVVDPVTRHRNVRSLRGLADYLDAGRAMAERHS